MFSYVISQEISVNTLKIIWQHFENVLGGNTRPWKCQVVYCQMATRLRISEKLFYSFAFVTKFHTIPIWMSYSAPICVLKFN